MTHLIRTVTVQHEALTNLNPSTYVQSHTCDACNISPCCDQRQENCWSLKDSSLSPCIMLSPISKE